jgi:FkbM family methyltransferase
MNDSRQMQSSPSMPASADSPATIAQIDVDGHRYVMQLPDAGTDYIQTKIGSERQPYEREMLEDMCARLAPGDLVLDVGANVGNHAMYLAVVGGCRVEAFEPNTRLCDAIAASAALNGIAERVRVHRTGVGQVAATASFQTELPDNLGAQRLSLGQGEIPVVPLDSLGIEGPVKAIKIDVEGMEGEVLRGGQALIERDRPMIYVECQREPDFRRVARWLERRSYGLWDTFNATPTHLFLPCEALTQDQRLNRILSNQAAQQYRLNQQWTAIKRLLQPTPTPAPPRPRRPATPMGGEAKKP